MGQERYTVTSEEVSVPDKPEESTAIEEHEEIAEEECVADEFIPDTEESDACVWSPGSETGMQGSDLMRSKRTRQTSPVKARLHTPSPSPSPPPAAYTAADAAQAPTETATEQEQASADEIGAVAPALGFVAGTG